MLDLNEWLDYYKSRTELVDNKCHTLSRLKCDDIASDKWEKITQNLDSLSTKHLFHEPVPCVRRVFGQDDIEYTELILGANQFSNQSNDFQYFRLDSTSSTAYKIHVDFGPSTGKKILALDYLNCNERTDYTDKPDDKVNCNVTEDIRKFYIIIYEPGSPIYISLKYTYTVTINITTNNSIEVTGKTGSIQSDINRPEHFYSYKAPIPGYIFIEASMTMKNVEITLYYDTPGCSKHNTLFPRLQMHCLKKSKRNNVQLLIPNQEIDRTHYFGLVSDISNFMQFTYVLFGITEIREGITEFYSDNSFAMPFKYNAKKGSYNIRVTVSNEMVNKCNIYLDYAGCSTASTVLPNLHNYCLMTTDKTQETCSLKLVLDEDVDVFFGVESIISERMTVEIITNDKLVFLE
jgi:hypothetical protein